MTIPSNPRELLAAFPYMFTKVPPYVYRGWFPVFSQLCIDIDQRIGNEGASFVWTQLKEKLGSARFYWSSSLSDDIAFKQILQLVHAAERMTQKQCIVCGSPGKNTSSDGFWLVVCETHVADHIGREFDWEATEWTKDEI